MTNVELLARLREPYEQRQSRRVAEEFVAADRIEALARNLANTQADFTEQLGRATAYELRMIDAETYVEELEAKLAKAVELLEEIEVSLAPISGFFIDTFPRKQIKATLAEIK